MNITRYTIIIMVNIIIIIYWPRDRRPLECDWSARGTDRLRMTRRTGVRRTDAGMRRRRSRRLRRRKNASVKALHESACAFRRQTSASLDGGGNGGKMASTVRRPPTQPRPRLWCRRLERASAAAVRGAIARTPIMVVADRGNSGGGEHDVCGPSTAAAAFYYTFIYVVALYTYTCI